MTESSRNVQGRKKRTIKHHRAFRPNSSGSVLSETDDIYIFYLSHSLVISSHTDKDIQCSHQRGSPEPSGKFSADAHSALTRSVNEMLTVKNVFQTFGPEKETFKGSALTCSAFR